MPSNGPVYSVGRYWGRALSQSFGKSKNKGTPQFSITFDIKGAVDPSNPEGELLRCEEGQRTVFWYLTEGTMPYVLEDLERLGFNKPSLRFLDANVNGYFDFAGIEQELYCKHEAYEGKRKEKWSLSNPRAGTIEAEPLESNEVRKLDALFGKGLKALAAKAPETAPVASEPERASDATAVATAEPEENERNEDDMPF